MFIGHGPPTEGGSDHASGVYKHSPPTEGASGRASAAINRALLTEGGSGRASAAINRALLTEGDLVLPGVYKRPPTEGAGWRSGVYKRGPLSGGSAPWERNCRSAALKMRDSLHVISLRKQVDPTDPRNPVA